MNAEVLFAIGGLRVRESPKGPIVGFVWVEPADEGQLQRWVLKKTLGADKASVQSYVFEPWVDAERGPVCNGLPSWNEAVGKRLVGSNEWGQHPKEDGLWPQEGGIYVVAQSTHMIPQITSGGPVFFPPVPIYPRHKVAESLIAAPGSGAMAAGPGAAIAGRIGRRPPEPIAAKPSAGRPHGLDKLTTKRWTPQIVVPLAWIHQWEEGKPEVGSLQPGIGICGGFTNDEKDKTYFEGHEMFLLEPAYLRAGTAGMLSRWSEKAAGGVSSPAELRALIEKSWKVGCHYEVTGCNYYQGGGESPPPMAFR